MEGKLDEAKEAALGATAHDPVMAVGKTVDLRFAPLAVLGPRLDAPFVPSPKGRIEQALDLAQLTADDVLVDLGCGDGRVLHAAALKFGCRCIGVELDEQLLETAKAHAKAKGVEDKCSWLMQDCCSMDLKDATVVMIYMLPSAMGKLTKSMQNHLLQAKRLRKSFKIISMVFHFDGAVLRPSAVDKDWKLQLYDTSSLGTRHCSPCESG